MKKTLAFLLAVSFASTPAAGVNPFAAATAEAQEHYSAYDRRFSRHQLENLLAPVALYPDPLLAQILIAATFADQVEDAARFIRRYRDPYGIDQQPWDVSVKAVAHYPSVLHMMADRIDWTVALGQAYVEQPQEVMASVQFLRWRAHRHGNLVSDNHHHVIVEREYVEIVPVHPEVIYVPVYEPEVIFFRPAPLIVFGPAFPIGVWLNRDCDWHGRRIYYHGWRGDRHWVNRSRPHVRLTNVYVNNNFNTVRVNREVVRRNVNVTNLNRFTSVNREARFDNLERRNRGRDGLPDRDNRSIKRDADNPRPDRLRGRPAGERSAAREERSPQARQQNLAQPRENQRPQARVDRSQRTREETPPQAVENRSSRAREQRPPQVFENKSPRTREERPQALENRPRRNREDKQREVKAPSQPPREFQQSRANGARGDRGVEPRQRRERGEAVQARAQQPGSTPTVGAQRAQGKKTRDKREAEESRT